MTHADDRNRPTPPTEAPKSDGQGPPGPRRQSESPSIGRLRPPRWPTVGGLLGAIGTAMGPLSRGDQGGRQRSSTSQTDGDAGWRPHHSQMRSGGVTRVAALGAGLALIGAYVAVLHHVTGVVGGRTAMLTGVGAALVGATTVAMTVRPRVATVGALVALAIGPIVYMEMAPLGWQLLENVEKVTADTVALLSGVSVLRMRAADAWAVGFAPGAPFVSWYLLVRRRYVAGAGIGVVALLAFVLTGDASMEATLAGSIAAAATVGLGRLEQYGESLSTPPMRAELETLVVVLAAMVVVSSTVTVVPASEGSLFSAGGDPTIESSIVGAGERMPVVGSVDLQPEVRFVVESERRAYWRVGAYDRYTGDGWVRTGQASPYDSDELRRPPGESDRVVQRVRLKSSMSTVPAAWRPQEFVADADDTAEVTPLDGLRVTEPLEPGDEYTVVSRVLTPDAIDLRAADDDYPDGLEDRYTDLPADTPERLEEFTDRLAEGARTPYAVTRRIQSWLQTNKNYSLSVDRPDDRIATSFVFEMDAGYCTYFATAMTAMLRTQGIPARLAVGYTPGQRVGQDTYVVRGYNAHAWVEAYFPGIGWVRFDPTPADPREDRRQDRLDQARAAGANNIDAAGSSQSTVSATTTAPPTQTVSPSNPINTPAGGSESATPPGQFERAVTPGAYDQGGGRSGPSRNVLIVSLVALVGGVAGLRRSGVIPRIRRLIAVFQRPRATDPDQAVRRATHRLESVLERQTREREPPESLPKYLRALSGSVDAQLDRIGDAYERSVYGSGVDRETAETVVATVDEYIRDSIPLVGDE